MGVYLPFSYIILFGTFFYSYLQYSLDSGGTITLAQSVRLGRQSLNSTPSSSLSANSLRLSSSIGNRDELSGVFSNDQTNLSTSSSSLPRNLGNTMLTSTGPNPDPIKNKNKLNPFSNIVATTSIFTNTTNPAPSSSRPTTPSETSEGVSPASQQSSNVLPNNMPSNSIGSNTLTPNSSLTSLVLGMAGSPMKLLCDGKSIFKFKIKLSSSLIPNNQTVIGLD
jgi:hypothetical protein